MSEYIRIDFLFNSLDYERSHCSGIKAEMINDLQLQKTHFGKYNNFIKIVLEQLLSVLTPNTNLLILVNLIKSIYFAKT